MILNLDKIRQIQSLGILVPCRCNLCSPTILAAKQLSMDYDLDMAYRSLAGTTMIYYFKDSYCCVCFWQTGFDHWETFYSKNKCPYNEDFLLSDYVEFEEIFDLMTPEVKELIVFNINLFVRKKNEGS